MYTPCHCPVVGRKSGGSEPLTEAMVLSPPADSTLDVQVEVRHRDFPDWSFVVTFSGAGTPVGFKVIAEDAEPLWNEMLDGRVRPHGMSRRTSPDAPAVTARLLHRVPVGAIQDAARRAFRRYAELDDRVMRGLASPAVAELSRRIAGSARPGRRGRPDREYAELAAAYVHVLETSPHPVQALAEKLAFSPSTVANMLSEARRRGLLTRPSTPGQPGGELTPRARDVLDEGA
jgi:hypothetical protein